MSAAAARDLLTRLTERYQPPAHLMMNARARSAVLADYQQALSAFDAQVLDRAWQRLVSQHSGWIWPSCGELVKAAEFFAPQRRGPSEQEQRRGQAKALADGYTQRFLEKFHLAKLATQEDWLMPLKAYVTAAAWAQAQLIAGVLHVGWDADVLMPGQGTTQERFDAWRKAPAVDNAIARGQIRVEVPKDRIAQWRQDRRQPSAAAADTPTRGVSAVQAAGPCRADPF